MKKNLLLLFSAFLMQQAAAQCTSCTIPFVGSTDSSGNSSGVIIRIPSGVVANNVMIAAVHSGWCSSGSTVTPPAGWTLIANTSNTGSGCGAGNTSIQLSTFYKIATGSEPINYTFTGSTSQRYVGVIVAYSGVNTAMPINASANSGAQENCSNIIAPSVTTTACSRLLSVFFCSVNSSATNIIPEASLTERADKGNTGNHPWGNENVEVSDVLQTAAGASGVKTAALSGCSGTGWVTGAQMIALTCDVASGIDNHSIAESLVVIPNPSSGMFEIILDEKPGFVYEITDVIGRVVKKGVITEKKTMMDLTAEKKGIYLLKLSSPQGSVTKKIVVE